VADDLNGWRTNPADAPNVPSIPLVFWDGAGNIVIVGHRTGAPRGEKDWWGSVAETKQMAVQGLVAVRTRCQMINDAVARMEGTIQELEFVVFWSRGYRMDDMLAIALHSTSKLMLYIIYSFACSFMYVEARFERRRSSMWLNGG
jgi:hypothetical protein